MAASDSVEQRIVSVPRVLVLQDGPTGVRGTDFAKPFPDELHIGASWNMDLALEIANHMDKELRSKGGMRRLPLISMTR